MKIEYFNCPASQPFGTVSLPIEVEFLSYTPDFRLMDQLAEKYAGYKNILIIGHGGSINSFYGIYSALAEKATKKVYFLSTVDPDYITQLRGELSRKDTLVIAISKSGENTTQIEALSQFLDYPLLFITGADNPVAKIAESLGAQTITHPSIGGRYTGFTEVALAPAALCGFDVEAIFEAGRAVHNKFGEDNEAWQVASVLQQLEEKGFVDVFLPFYSHSLFGMSRLVVQLCHESFGKGGKGQTYFAHEGPELQHHSTQRFLGGRENIAGFFIGVENFHNSLSVQIPESMQSISIKHGSLKNLNNIPLQNSMKYEREATLQDAADLGIPALQLMVEQLGEKEIGQFMAFWQLYAVYAALLRGVNPFDQPAVENSKRISFDKRLASGK